MHPHQHSFCKTTIHKIPKLLVCTDFYAYKQESKNIDMNHCGSDVGDEYDTAYDYDNADVDHDKDIKI